MRTLVLLSLAATIVAAPASAVIVSGSVTTPGASFVKLTVPFTVSSPGNTVGKDNFQSPNLFGFDEDQNIVLGAPLSVDFLASTGRPGVLPAGTALASHYIFFDPVSGVIDGEVDFNSNILAIIFRRRNLAASDFLANTGVTYLNPGFRGLESGDTVGIVDADTIFFKTSASSPGDHIRVLTASSPPIKTSAPAALALFGLGLAAVGLRRRG